MPFYTYRSCIICAPRPSCPFQVVELEQEKEEVLQQARWAAGGCGMLRATCTCMCAHVCVAVATGAVAAAAAPSAYEQAA